MLTLFGYGKTNQAIAGKYPGQCRIFDDAFESESTDSHGNRLYPSSLFDPGSSQLEIVTPGIPPSNPLLASAHNPISDYDFFAREMPFSIWISGTNGKTTVTEMIGHLLENRGAVIGGNVGTPVADLNPDASMWILETSSFTLHYTTIAKPDIYILLPVSEDHITWHGGFDAYEESKLKPLKMMREGEAVLLPRKYAQRETDGFVIPYDDADLLAEHMGIDVTRLHFEGPFLLDAILALSVSRILFDEVDYEKMNRYRPGAHKIESFSDIQGRIWVDDSKATNCDATLQALAQFREKKILLILGGDDKGADLNGLFDSLKNFDVEIFAIGTNTERICDLATQREVPVNACRELNTAINQIAQKHDQKSIALLSPAAASLDQFRSYRERGEKFKEFVQNLR